MTRTRPWPPEPREGRSPRRGRDDREASARASRAQIEGRRAVLEALKSGMEFSSLRISGRAEPSAVLNELLEEARKRRVRAERVHPEVLDALSQTGHHQGVMADVQVRPPMPLETLLKRARAPGTDPFLVVLDGIEDPQNLGAIARSAEAAGAHGLVISTKRAAGVSPGSVRASAGALLLMPIAEVPNTARALEWLKSKDVWVAGTAPEGGTPYHQAKLGGPLAVVVGSESRGLHRLVRDRCDFLLTVPLEGRVGSLNASAAAAVVLFEVARQRRAAQPQSDERTKTPK